MKLLYEDPHLLAVDKPPGRIVIPGRGALERTLVDELGEAHGRLWVVHRLDRGTSGVLVFARSAEAHRALNLAFDSRRVEKRYLALVRGAPPDVQLVDAWIAPARKGRMKPVPAGDPRGKAAATAFSVVERFPGDPALALVECVPETGRTHQIRVHLLAAGTPLAVDPDYGTAEPLRGAAGEALLARTPLHARVLGFEHPASGAAVRIEAPWPADIAAAVAWARARQGSATAG